MLEKTFKKLLKKEESKPYHCIDTSVFLESTLDTKSGDICKSHLNNMGKGKYFRGIIPVSVLGEISMFIFRDVKELSEISAKFDLLEKLVRFRDIDFITPEMSDYQMIIAMSESERGMEAMDAQHLACAKRAGADVFITLDSHLINNKNLEGILGFTIKHPSEFVSI